MHAIGPTIAFFFAINETSIAIGQRMFFDFEFVLQSAQRQPD